jgi:hypothetical protein
MNRRSSLPSQVGVMQAPGYGALQWVRPMRRRGNLAVIALMTGGGAMAALALIGALSH